MRTRAARSPNPRRQHAEQDGLWAIDIKRGLSARAEKGFHVACQDLKPARRFVVNSGSERHPVKPGIEAIGVHALAEMLAGL